MPLAQRLTNIACSTVFLTCLVGSVSPLRAQSGDELTMLPAPVVRTASIRSTAPRSMSQSDVLFSGSKLLLPGWALSSPEAHAMWQGRLEEAIDERVTVFGGYARRGSRGFLGLRLRF